MSQKSRWVFASIVGTIAITAVLAGYAFLTGRTATGQATLEPTTPAPAATAVSASLQAPAGAFVGTMLVVSDASGQHVYLVTADSMQSLQLSSGDVHSPAPELSPDGSRIAFRDENGALNLYDLKEKQTSTYSDLFLNGGTELGWSADGDQVLYGCPTLISDLCSFDLSAGQNRQFTQADQSQNGYGGYHFAGGSADGTKVGLLYWASPKDQVEGVKTYYVGSLYVLDVQTQKLTPVFDEKDLKSAQHIRDAALSPDGKTFLFSASSGDKYAVFRVKADGSGLEQVTPKDLGYSVYHPVWSPDGKYFVATAPQLDATDNAALNQPTIFDLKGNFIVQLNIPGGGEPSSWVN